MNNFNYLLLIILLIILLFYIYINCNIEYFQQLPKADLGPIKFVDADNTDEVLGKFPPDWDENELYRPENNLEPTIIKIKRGPKGFKGNSGSGGLPGKCEGNINISSINGDKLEINSSKLNILSENVKFKKNMCFGDDDTACLNKDLIDKINYNNTIKKQLEILTEQTTDGTYVRGELLTAKAAELANAIEQRDKHKTNSDDCNSLKNNPLEYVTRDNCNKELKKKEEEWRGPNETLEGVNAGLLDDLATVRMERNTCLDEKKDPLKYRSFDDWNDTNKKLIAAGALVQTQAEKLKDYEENWCKKRAKATAIDKGCNFHDLHRNEQILYGEIAHSNPDIDRDKDKYIKIADCKWDLANDKKNYGRKIAEHVDLPEDRVFRHGDRWGLIKSPDVDHQPYGLYGKIAQVGSGGEGYIKQSECTVQYATDVANYGSKDDYGLIGNTAGDYGLIGEGVNEFMLNSACALTYDQYEAAEKTFNIDSTMWGKVGDAEGYFGEIGEERDNYIKYSDYLLAVNEKQACMDKTDYSDIKSINKNSMGEKLEITGDSLTFQGKSVSFKNKFCIKDLMGKSKCLTIDDIKKMNESPHGPKGPPGVCSPE